MDERLRELERRAEAGDTAAQEALAYELHRRGVGPPVKAPTTVSLPHDGRLVVRALDGSKPAYPCGPDAPVEIGPHHGWEASHYVSSGAELATLAAGLAELEPKGLALGVGPSLSLQRADAPGMFEQDPAYEADPPQQALSALARLETLDRLRLYATDRWRPFTSEDLAALSGLTARLISLAIEDSRPPTEWIAGLDQPALESLRILHLGWDLNDSLPLGQLRALAAASPRLSRLELDLPLRDSVGKELAGCLHLTELLTSSLSPRAAESLRELPLEELRAIGSVEAGCGAEDLRQLPRSLRALSLRLFSAEDAPPWTAARLESLRRLDHLESLDLSEVEVTSEGLAALLELPALCELDLAATWFSGEPDALASLPTTSSRLKSLRITLGATALARLEAWEAPALEELTILGALGSVDWQPLGRLSRLVYLELEGEEAGRAVRAARQLSRLEELVIVGARVGPGSVAEVTRSDLRSLRCRITLERCRFVGGESAASLRSELADLRVIG